ncbi:DUF6895 family protein [Streptomyces montanisoli]|uniref:DUF6895 domain-containing protein n=1 Tax=Streptomyces montanisoli TaxID=2798581 RepID=A0A940M6M0_9ACTN|nr:hypothetical protein [Streptomyces montanisoli]MBP0457154.1 hypothetical protein [Streptomyces montanisoli]
MTSPGAVRAVGEAALGWIQDHRADFRLGEDALDPAGDVNRTWKPLGELAQVSLSVRRATGPGDRLHDTADGLLRYAWTLTGKGAFFHDVLRLEPFSTYALEIYAAFAAAGMRHAPFEELAATMAGTRGWRLTEQQPNRRLGVLNSERRVGLPQHRSPERALRATWLGGLPEPWTFETASGYTLTHVVFHLTDWGGDASRVPGDIASYLGLWLPAWLDSCAEDDQWDLLAELLAVAAALPEPPPPALLHGAWSALAAAQDTGGGLPETGPGRHGRTERRGFADCYHSTLMAAFAAALALGGHDPRRDSEGAPA